MTWACLTPALSGDRRTVCAASGHEVASPLTETAPSHAPDYPWISCGVWNLLQGWSATDQTSPTRQKGGDEI